MLKDACGVQQLNEITKDTFQRYFKSVNCPEKSNTAVQNNKSCGTDLHTNDILIHGMDTFFIFVTFEQDF